MILSSSFPRSVWGAHVGTLCVKSFPLSTGRGAGGERELLEFRL